MAKKSSSKTQRRKGKPTLAERADRHALYLRSVQEPSVEVKFFQRVYRKQFGSKPRVLREDFCGTAAICYEWVRRKPKRRAIGVDLDGDPLQWGRDHLASKLPDDARDRVTLLQQDVREISDDKADVVAAQNFSFWCFKTREEATEYFAAVRDNLADRGVFVLDMMGGYETQHDEQEEVSDKGGFDYIWEHEWFDPISHDCVFHIHFRFKDGSRIKRAFTYQWRLWSIPEVREMLEDAGFDRVDVYWEGTDDDGEGDGVFRKRTRGTADASWIAYIVAVKGAPSS